MLTQFLPILPALNDRQFTLVMRQLSNRMATGGNASVFLGAGSIFLQTRPYQPGDSVRLIDWRVTARSNGAHVKQFETPMHTPVHLVVDRSASMSHGSGELSKYGTAVLLAGGLAYTAAGAGNPVSIMASDQLGCPRPTSSWQSLTRALRQLRSYTPANATALGSALHKVRQALIARSYVIVLSDFHDRCAVEAMKIIALRHECLAIQLRDVVEEVPAGAGFVHLRSAESAAAGLLSGGDAPSSPSSVTEALAQAGVQVLRLSPHQAFDPQVRAFLRKTAMQPWKQTRSTRF